MHAKSTIFLTALCLLIFASCGTASPARQEREDNSSPEPPPFNLPPVSIYQPFNIEGIPIKTYFAAFSEGNLNAALVLEHDLTDNRFQLSVKDDPIVQGSRVRGTAGRGWKVEGYVGTGKDRVPFDYYCMDTQSCNGYVRVDPNSPFAHSVVAQKRFTPFASLTAAKDREQAFAEGPQTVTADLRKLDDADNAPSSGAAGP